MSKITYTHIKKMLKECGIGYNYNTIQYTPYAGFVTAHDWDHGYETYYGYNGCRREFYYDLFLVMSCIKEYIEKCNISYYIASPLYHDTFAVNYKACDDYYDIVSETRDFLKSNNVNPRTQSGIIVDSSDTMTISMIIEGAFRGASCICLFSPERKVVIQPDHHFQTTFFTAHADVETSLLADLLKSRPDLELYSSNEQCVGSAYDGIVATKLIEQLDDTDFIL